MTQISRPFQIALAAVVLIAVVWFVALRGHSSSGESSSSSSAPAPTVVRTTPASAPTASTKASTSAPSLTKAIDKARATAKQNELKALHARAVQPHATAKPTAATKPATAHAAKPTTAPGAKPASKLVNQQAAVEGELKQGRTVIVLFWSPRGAVDVAVRFELARLIASLKRTGARRWLKNIAVHYSSMGEVGKYGSITRSIQILGTPTMLVIAPDGKTKTLTGLIDPYTVVQAIGEAHSV